jgi:hypothetical protein
MPIRSRCWSRWRRLVPPALLLAGALGTGRAMAADFGGFLALTSDYIYRGASQTAHDPVGVPGVIAVDSLERAASLSGTLRAPGPRSTDADARRTLRFHFRLFACRGPCQRRGGAADGERPPPRRRCDPCVAAANERRCGRFPARYQCVRGDRGRPPPGQLRPGRPGALAAGSATSAARRGEGG